VTLADASLSDAERLDRLRLIRSDSVGPVTFGELVGHFGSAGAALEALPALARRSGRSIRVCPRADAEREIEKIAALGARLLVIGEPAYPAWLAAVDGAPPVISVQGDPACLARPAVAVVGARNASVAGRKFAMRIAADIGAAGFVVASGLARGIDAAAHTAALPTGTIAVFAGGLDRPYPAENIPLAAEIVARGGANLSEMPLGWEPRARDFPRRNRIISGLALGVVVVEAALRSGSLITARRAADQGRLVFAVPGSPLDPRSGGSNLLIKEGATIVTAVDDIIADLQPMLGRQAAPSPVMREPAAEAPYDAEDADRARILEALGPTPVDLDDIIRFTGIKPAIVHLVLIELDLAGRIARHPHGRVSLLDAGSAT
jgi:DNA processing protein